MACYITITVAVLSCYLVAVDAPFIFDDQFLIQELSSKTLFQVIHPSSGFRPLYKLTFLLNHTCNGNSPLGYHLVNIAIHIFNCCLLFKLIRMTLNLPGFSPVFGKSVLIVSCVCALIWGLHPLQTQAVTYLSQRCEIMMAMFGLMMLYFVIKSRQSCKHTIQWQLLALIALFAGLLSKEAIISIPVLVILYDRVLLSTSIKEMCKKGKLLYGGFILAALFPFIYLAMKGNLLEEIKNYLGYMFHRHGIDSWQYLLTQTQVILYYLRLVFWPSPLCFDHHWPLVTHISQAFVPLCIIAVLIISLIVLMYNNIYLAFPLLFFAINLLPRSSIIVSTNSAVEYRMYLPLAGLVVFCVMVVFLTVKRIKSVPWKVRQLLLLFMTLCIIPGLAAITIKRNLIYNDPYLLWKDTITQYPNNVRALNYFGIELAKRKEYDKAYTTFSDILKNYPTNIMALNNLANIYAERGQYENAVQLYEKSLKVEKHRSRKDIIKQFNFITHANLAKIYSKMNNMGNAVLHFQQALSLSPGDLDLMYRLGELYMQAGKIDKAKRHFVKIIAQHKTFPYAYLNLGLIAARNNQYQEAEVYFRKAIQYKPDYQPAHYNLGLLLSEMGKLSQGVTYFKQAHQLNPQDTETLKCLCFTLKKLGNTSEFNQYSNKLKQLHQGKE